MRVRTRLLAVGLAAATALAPCVAALTPASAAGPSPQQTQLVSISSSGVAADYPVRGVSTSADGRYVAFASKATNLTSISTGFPFQVYLRDTVAGTTTMVSSLAGVAGTDNSLTPSVSADGRFVAFTSSATNLGLPGSTGAQAVLWNRETGSLRLASVTNGPTPVPANGEVGKVSLSADGSKVAFESHATNLTPENTNGVAQIYVHDFGTGQTQMVSVDATAASPSGGSSSAIAPSISDDGNVVAFLSDSVLTTTATSRRSQVYVRDVAAGMTRLESVDAAGTGGADGSSIAVSLSGDGHSLSFSSNATNILPGITVDSSTYRVYLRDLDTGVTQIVSVDADGNPTEGWNPSTSRAGDRVAFSSRANGIDPVIRNSVYSDTYVRDMTTTTTSMVSVSSEGNSSSEPGDGTVFETALSADGSHVAFISGGTNLVPSPTTRSNLAYIRNIADPGEVVRVGGASRFDVSAATSARIFPAASHGVAYIASGESYPDALAASAAAGRAGGPVLLTNRDQISAVVLSELERLSPRAIVVVGGPSTVADNVIGSVQAALPGIPVNRTQGADRFGTAAAISQLAFAGGAETVFVASGENFPDALAAGPAAGRDQGPVLLTQRDGVPGVIAAEIQRLQPRRIVVVGGTGSISDAVVSQLTMLAPTTRTSGADRYSGSAALSQATFPASTRTVFVVSGEVFPDALSGAAAAIASRGPLLLVTKADIPAAVATELRRLNPVKIIVLGGPNTVSDAVVSQLQGYLRAG